MNKLKASAPRSELFFGAQKFFDPFKVASKRFKIENVIGAFAGLKGDHYGRLADLRPLYIFLKIVFGGGSERDHVIRVGDDLARGLHEIRVVDDKPAVLGFDIVPSARLREKLAVRVYVFDKNVAGVVDPVESGDKVADGVIVNVLLLSVLHGRDFTREVRCRHSVREILREQGKILGLEIEALRTAAVGGIVFFERLQMSVEKEKDRQKCHDADDKPNDRVFDKIGGDAHAADEKYAYDRSYENGLAGRIYHRCVRGAFVSLRKGFFDVFAGIYFVSGCFFLCDHVSGLPSVIPKEASLFEVLIQYKLFGTAGQVF